MTKHISEPATYPLLCTDCAHHLIMDQQVLIKRTELERLQNLDTNIKREIEKLELDLEQAAEFITGTYFIKKEIERLKSLYDKNPQES